VKGKVKEKWADLTDDDLARLEGSKDQLAGVIQERYGLQRKRLNAKWMSGPASSSSSAEVLC
jgi:uncharacterized protein YjbJ (UPF0337 family)